MSRRSAAAGTRAPVVRPAYGPSLPALLAAPWRRLARPAQVAIVALVALLLGLAAAKLLAGEEIAAAQRVVHTSGPVSFNFRVTDGLRRERPHGDELERVAAQRPDGLFEQSFAVRPLRLPAYRGDPSGLLPVYASGLEDRLRARYADFDLVQEGRTRVNEVIGYQVAFRARRSGRTLFGKAVVLPEPVPGARQGVILIMESTFAGGISSALDVGVDGKIKRAYRSFRFGTETGGLGGVATA